MEISKNEDYIQKLLFTTYNTMIWAEMTKAIKYDAQELDILDSDIWIFYIYKPPWIVESKITIQSRFDYFLFSEISDHYYKLFTEIPSLKCDYINFEFEPNSKITKDKFKKMWRDISRCNGKFEISGCDFQLEKSNSKSFLKVKFMSYFHVNFQMRYLNLTKNNWVFSAY